MHYISRVHADAMHKKFPTLTRATVALLFIVLLIHALEATSELVVPILLAMMFAFMLFPFASRLEKWRIPRAIADFTVVFFVSALFVAIIFLFYKQMAVFGRDLPFLRAQAIHNIGAMEMYIDDHVPFAPQNHENWLEEKVAIFLNNGQGPLTAAFATTAASFGKLLILPFVIFFMLFYRERFRDFALEIVPVHKKEETVSVLDEISQVTKQYMGGLFTVVAIIATINCISLSIMGVKYAIFLGLLAAMFNFIPYFGTLFGAVIPVLVTFLTNESPKYALFVVIHFLIIQLLEHNFFTPNITGSRVRINPLVTLFSLISGALLFGVAGMFLAIPLMGMFKIFCEHVESLKPLGKIIGEPERPELSLTPVDGLGRRWWHFRK